MADLLIGLAATKAAWSTAFRSYVRDHTQGIAVEIIMDRFALARSGPSLDLLVVDDIMRTFSASEIATAQELGIHVLGLYDNGSGMGREHLVRLGVDEVVPATTPPAELVALISERQPSRSPAPGSRHGTNKADTVQPGRGRGKRGLVLAWTKVSGGAGLSEAMVAVAEHLGKRARTLLIEADEVGPSSRRACCARRIPVWPGRFRALPTARKHCQTACQDGERTVPLPWGTSTLYAGRPAPPRLSPPPNSCAWSRRQRRPMTGFS